MIEKVRSTVMGLFLRGGMLGEPIAAAYSGLAQGRQGW
jgi:hypothetical protein